MAKNRKSLPRRIVLPPEACEYARAIYARMGVENPTIEEITMGIIVLLKEVNQHSEDPTSNLRFAINKAFGFSNR